LVNNLGAATKGGDIMEQEKKEAQVKVETLEARLKEWGIDLEKFRAKADKTKGKAKAELESRCSATGSGGLSAPSSAMSPLGRFNTFPVVLP
jgi:hypothetical protein